MFFYPFIISCFSSPSKSIFSSSYYFSSSRQLFLLFTFFLPLFSAPFRHLFLFFHSRNVLFPSFYHFTSSLSSPFFSLLYFIRLLFPSPFRHLFLISSFFSLSNSVFSPLTISPFLSSALSPLLLLIFYTFSYHLPSTSFPSLPFSHFRIPLFPLLTALPPLSPALSPLLLLIFYLSFFQHLSDTSFSFPFAHFRIPPFPPLTTLPPLSLTLSLSSTSFSASPFSSVCFFPSSFTPLTPLPLSF